MYCTFGILWLEDLEDSLTQIKDKVNQFLDLCKYIEREIKDLKNLQLVV